MLGWMKIEGHQKMEQKRSEVLQMEDSLLMIQMMVL
jgi:hypothetical protein